MYLIYILHAETSTQLTQNQGCSFIASVEANLHSCDLKQKPLASIIHPLCWRVYALLDPITAVSSCAMQSIRPLHITDNPYCKQTAPPSCQ